MLTVFCFDSLNHLLFCIQREITPLPYLKSWQFPVCHILEQKDEKYDAQHLLHMHQ